MLFPSVRLITGTILVNFSSPHSFKLDDGQELLGCAPEHAKLLECAPIEVETPHPTIEGTIDLDLSFKLTEICLDAIKEAVGGPKVIVLVSLPTITALKAAGEFVGKIAESCRTIRAERVTRVVSTTRFCK